MINFVENVCSGRWMSYGLTIFLCFVIVAFCCIVRECLDKQRKRAEIEAERLSIELGKPVPVVTSLGVKITDSVLNSLGLFFLYLPIFMCILWVLFKVMGVCV